jgi:dolichyl-phosphate-mannose--protein O-mannosyl transferase
VTDSSNARPPAYVYASRSIQSGWLFLTIILILGLVWRLASVRAQGFPNDISSFEAWARALVAHGPTGFYASTNFVDYPPGYFYILDIVGQFWSLFFKADAAGLEVLAILVKLPAILFDLALGVLVYAVARRFGSEKLALGAVALYVLNPAVVFVSALWGQVDSVACFFALLGVYALLRSDDFEPQPANQRRKSARGVLSARATRWIVGGWIALAYSLLIKPQAAVMLPLIIAFAFVDPRHRCARITATGIGIGAAILFALLIAEPFHPGNPISTFDWLAHLYSYGSNLYPYNSVNAFNLWALRGTLWVPDNQKIVFLSQYAWGTTLVLAALGLIVWRYLQDRTPQALLEGCAIATLAFFTLATRMHERYIFNGLVFTIACIPFARRYLWGAVAISIILFANLAYSLEYVHVVSSNIAGANTQNLWGTWTTVLSLVAVGVFFWLGYQYLETSDVGAGRAAPARGGPGAAEEAGGEGTRNWFDPREGLAVMRMPLDYAIMVVLGIGNFILSFVGYWRPNGSSCWAEAGLARCGIFDETYFARAGEEYLQNLRIYENTHPPLSKLLITFSMMLFGGMPRGHGLGGWTFLNGMIGHMSNGDNPYGWRFLDLVFGALVVMLLYCFAKRVTDSTLFATTTALLLTFDGMHFVQSRTATPEGFVIFFATLAVYAFYRFWISSQVGERGHVVVPWWAFAGGAAAALAIGAAIGQICRIFCAFDAAATSVVTLYVMCLTYLLVRYLIVRRQFGDGCRELTYAEGSYALRGGDGTTVFAADGGTIDARGKIARGAISQAKGGVLVYDDDPLRIEYHRDASVSYETPKGGAVYAADEIRAGNATEKGNSSKLWLILFTVALGLLVSAKWYGVMGFGVSFVVVILVWLQRYFFVTRPTLWGNPRGFHLDSALVTIVFVSMTIYALAWVPDLARHSPDPNEIHNFNDVVYRQYSMFEYHDVGVAHATHPYSSKWWEWPLDYVPVAYFYLDQRQDPSDPRQCCVSEVTSLPNPIVLWFGLFSVPFVAVLALRLRNKAYALIVLDYVLQWVPWAGSPRITFAYHFYVNIPLICLCNAIALQHLSRWSKLARKHLAVSTVSASVYVTMVIAAFIYFYPILSAHPITWNAWHERMWIDKWIIGPG